MEDKYLEKFIFILVLLSALLTFTIYVYFSPQRYFMGDDFPLLLSAQSFESIFQPVGAHFRPILRIHFFIFNKIFKFYPFFFNFLSIILHIFVSYSLYLVVKEKINKKSAIFSSFFFFLLFPYNEAIYWVSAVGVVYSLLFSLLSIYFFNKNRSFLSLLFLLLASFSYETWIILPFYFIFSKNKNYLLLTITSFSLIALQLVFAILSSERIYSYGGFPSLKEIPPRIFYYFYKNFFPFSYISYSPFVSLLSILFIVFSIYGLLHYIKIFFLPFLFYFIPSLIFLMSYYIPSRFFYFPTVSFVILIAILSFEKKIWRLISSTIIVYLSILSPIINYLDGLDYLHYSMMHKSIIDQGEKLLEEVKPGDKILLINTFSVPLSKISANSVKGCPKIFLHRGKGIGGLIDLEVFINFVLWKKGMRSVKLEEKQNGKKIVIGNGDFVSEYHFEVVKIKE